MRDARRWILPFAILGLGALGVALLMATRPQVEPDPPEAVAPLVRVVPVVPAEYRFVVHTQGTVVPRTESDLVPQVSGEVVWVSPALVSGGSFAAGDPLLRIERADYEVELEGARASAARTRSEYERARKELERQRKLAAQGVASQARIDDAENAHRVAEAAWREARARVERTTRDLARTEIVAPYDGRVRAESVDVGQFVSRGAAVATLYAVDYAEVRLPLPDRELAYLDLPLGGRQGDAEAAPEVRLRAEFAGQDRVWHGRIVRTEGEIDPRSRMVHAVARVEDPYGQYAGRAPLAVGLFVEAEILGRRVPEAVVLPRAALRDAERVLVVDAEARLRFRDVEVLRVDRDQVVVAAGLARGERVCISPLPGAVDGMAVRVAEGEPALARVEAQVEAQVEAGRAAP